MPINTGIRTITPGEFMLQAATIDRRQQQMDIAEKELSLQERQVKIQEQRQLLADKLFERDETALHDLAAAQATISGIADPIERMQAISRLPSSLWSNEKTSQIMQGMATRAAAEWKMKNDLDEATGIAEQRKRMNSLLLFGATPQSIKAGPGDPIYDAAAELQRKSRAARLAAESGVDPSKINLSGSLPAYADGTLDEETFIGIIKPMSRQWTQVGMTASEKDFAKTQELKAKVESFEPGTPEWTAAKSELDEWIQTIAPKGMRITTVGPGGETQTIETAVAPGQKGPDIPTTGFLKEMQSKITDNRINIRELDALAKNIQPGDVGVFGKASEFFLDRFGPMVGLKTADIGRMERRVALKMTFEGLKRDISSDTRFNREDLRDLKKIGISDDWWNSADNVRTAARIIGEYMAKRNVTFIQAAKQSLAWTDLDSPAEVWAAYSMGIGPDGQRWDAGREKELLEQYQNFIGGKTE